MLHTLKVHRQNLRRSSGLQQSPFPLRGPGSRPFNNAPNTGDCRRGLAPLFGCNRNCGSGPRASKGRAGCVLLGRGVASTSHRDLKLTDLQRELFNLPVTHPRVLTLTQPASERHRTTDISRGGRDQHVSSTLEKGGKNLSAIWEKHEAAGIAPVLNQVTAKPESEMV